MIQTIDGIFDGEAFRPIDKVDLPNGTRVRLRVELVQQTEGPAPNAKAVPTLLERLTDFVGIADDLPEDLSVNLDHYLYGTPKRKNSRE